MGNDTFSGLVGVFVGVVITSVLCFVISSAENSEWERKAIEHGAARYNPSTSKFEWLDEVEKASSEEH